MEKVTKRQLQAQNTREKIYRTSVELMEKKGLNNITVEEICKEAGVSIGSFYNCFQSKNDILNEIYKVADDYFQNVVERDMQDGSTSDKIIRFFCYYAEYNVNRGLEFVKHLYNPRNTMFIKKGRHMQLVLQRVIEEAQVKGEIQSDMTSEEIVEYLFISLRGVVYDWCLHNGQYDLVEFVRNYVKRLIKAIY
ncbi:MAG TPA: TetR/AcrR family transcriptional regulator [Candidatus Nitrosocosmicus sp.]|nr:TetR/AcrR family transcriptional regulator [Candidatus Nitrosocosmicus sp.]